MTKSFTVKGMTCGNCERHVREAAEKVAGVTSVTVDRPGEKATVSFDESVTNAGAIAAAITDAGYDTTPHGGGATGHW
ncbi:MAG: heavy-metal-associated domain-containing protein [Acidobacteria bacterium]|nr:heavy-metal-associated domain-containing protein [Acidobacteriota bacterium]